MPGVSDSAGSRADLPWRLFSCCFPRIPTASAPGIWMISELNALPVDAPVQRFKCGFAARPRMARGQGGWLLLPCTTLSFAAPRRFIPALSSRYTMATSDSLPGFVPALSGVTLIRFPTSRSRLRWTDQGLSGCPWQASPPRDRLAPGQGPAELT
jgi:hypothetical protein